MSLRPSLALFHRPTLTLEEKELSLRSLEENHLAWIQQGSLLHSALHRGEQLLSDRIGELQELNTQVTCALASPSPGTHNTTFSFSLGVPSASLSQQHPLLPCSAWGHTAAAP